jgi:O-antigen/teichoic acid export membrane protein
MYLDYLGTEFIGLTGTLSSLLGFLNLAELGVGTAIGYVLYKPIFDDDKMKINEIISVFGYIYHCIGLFIIFCGVILSIFLPLIFPDTSLSMGVIYFGFYAYLASSMLGYFVNYRQTLLSADQRNYVVTGYFQMVSSAQVIVQLIAAILWRNFYLYFLISIVFGIINSVILQWKINRTYPWLKSDVKLGRKLLAKYPEIGKYVRQLFVHKIGGFVQFQLSPFLIYAYVSLPVVALYGNYTIITEKVNRFFFSMLGTTSASVGNLISEGNRDKIYHVYCELLSLRVLASGFMFVCLLRLINPFVALWLGDEYIMPNVVVYLICAQTFLHLTRFVNDDFIYGYGLFYDVWSPIAEALIFVVASVALGATFGLSGVLCGPLVSTLIIIYGWKPYFLYSKGFKRPLYEFWMKFALYLILFALSSIIAIYLSDYLHTLIHLGNGWMGLIVDAITFAIMLGVLSVGIYYLFLPEFRTFMKKIIKHA